jgi:hypothetical protein
MRHSQKVDPDRFLVQQSGIYYYWRRVPARFLPLDGRTASGLIRASLKTDDLAEARAKRDMLEAADQDIGLRRPFAARGRCRRVGRRGGRRGEGGRVQHPSQKRPGRAGEGGARRAADLRQYHEIRDDGDELELREHVLHGGRCVLRFLPMLPVQILLNNLLYDLSELPIPLETVDRWRPPLCFPSRLPGPGFASNRPRHCFSLRLVG